MMRKRGSTSSARACAMPSDFAVPGTPQRRKYPSQSSTEMAAAPFSNERRFMASLP